LYIDLSTLWQYARDFISSNAFVAITSSCAGAYFGAYGAQRIVARGKERDEILTNMRNTNAATVVSYSICNTFLVMKKQHIKPLKDRFETQKRSLLEHVEKATPGIRFRFVADLSTIFASPIAIDMLRQKAHPVVPG
jgi:hypothetical protein